jgi:hypothetical protein
VPEREYVLVANSQTGAIGCAIIQSVMGGTVPNEKLCQFDWETRIENMTPYRMTEAQLDALIEARR